MHRDVTIQTVYGQNFQGFRSNRPINKRKNVRLGQVLFNVVSILSVCCYILIVNKMR